MARHRSTRKHRFSRFKGECRGSHSYTAGQAIGAGIIRYVCSECWAVSIDITGAEMPTVTGSLFEAAEGTLGRT